MVKNPSQPGKASAGSLIVRPIRCGTIFRRNVPPINYGADSLVFSSRAYNAANPIICHVRIVNWLSSQLGVPSAARVLWITRDYR
jgi:hypothetical protein